MDYLFFLLFVLPLPAVVKRLWQKYKNFNTQMASKDTISKDKADSYATAKSVGLLGFGGSLITQNLVLYRSLKTSGSDVWDKGVLENLLLASIVFNSLSIFLTGILAFSSPEKNKAADGTTETTTLGATEGAQITTGAPKHMYSFLARHWNISLSLRVHKPHTNFT